MAQEKKPSRFFNWVYIPIIAPLIVIFFGSFITGKIILQITGFQLSIGLTFLVILCIFVAMSVSFYLGMLFLPLAIFSWFIKDKRKWPLQYRMLYVYASIVTFPFILYEKLKHGVPNHKPERTSPPTIEEMIQSLRDKKPTQSSKSPEESSQ